MNSKSIQEVATANRQVEELFLALYGDVEVHVHVDDDRVSWWTDKSLVKLVRNWRNTNKEDEEDKWQLEVEGFRTTRAPYLELAIYMAKDFEGASKVVSRVFWRLLQPQLCQDRINDLLVYAKAVQMLDSFLSQPKLNDWLYRHAREQDFAGLCPGSDE